MLCPRCGHEESAELEECPRCGVLFERLRSPLEDLRSPLDRRPAAPPPPARGRRVRAVSPHWSPGSGRAVAVGSLLAMVVYAVPAARFVFSHLAIVSHEIGHTVVAWAMGYPAIPTLDLIEGGGVSIRYARSPLLCLLVLATSATLVVLVRRTRWLLPAAGLAAVHLFLLLSPWHDAAIVAAGHAAELVFAGLALARGLAGEGTLGERAAWVGAGVFVLMLNAAFGLRLLVDAAELERYAAARRGETGMDLVRLAEAFGGTVDTFAALIVLACLLVPPAVLLWAREP